MFIVESKIACFFRQHGFIYDFFFTFLSNKDLSLSIPGGADLNPVSHSDFLLTLNHN